jgi:hypothetical protein
VGISIDNQFALCVHREFVPPQKKEEEKDKPASQVLLPMPYHKLVSFLRANNL